LQQQQQQLARLDALLAQYSSYDLPLSNEIQANSQPPADIRKKPLQEALQLCHQVQQIGTQSVQKIRALSQLLNVHHSS